MSIKVIRGSINIMIYHDTEDIILSSNSAKIRREQSYSSRSQTRNISLFYGSAEVEEQKRVEDVTQTVLFTEMVPR